MARLRSQGMVSWSATVAVGLALVVGFVGCSAPVEQNQSPTVSAGADQTIALPTNQVDLDATVTDDGLPNPPGAVTVTWSKQSGEGTVTFGDAHAADTTATFGAAGVYVLKLSADDGAETADDTVEITVNSAPAAGLTIPAAGGEVDAADGDVTLTAPAGAVAEDTEISVQEESDPPDDPAYVPGTAFAFGPDGTAFQQPVALTIAYDPNAIPSEVSEESLKLAKAVSGAWEAVAGSSVDTTAKTVTGNINGFSVYGIIGSTEPTTTTMRLIAAGEFSTFAVGTLDGRLWSWGRNVYGMLGDGTESDRKSPVEVDSPTGFTAIVGGTGSTWALIGSNVYYSGVGWRYTTNPLAESHGFVIFPGLPAIEHLGMPYMIDGDKQVWQPEELYIDSETGWEGTGEPGPVPFTANKMFIGIVRCPPYDDYAIRDDGTVWRWHYYENDVNRDYHFEEQQVNTLTQVKAIEQGWLREGNPATLVILEDENGDDVVWGWGGNANGQLGNGEDHIAYNSYSPVRCMGSLTGVKAVACGKSHSLVLLNNGDLYAAGWNHWGQLGDGTEEDRNTPVKVMSGVEAIAAGSSHSIALKDDGTVWTWGHNYYGQLGLGKNPQDGDEWWSVATPTQVVFPSSEPTP